MFSRDNALGVDLKSVRCHKVKQNTIHHHLQHYYELKPLQVLCEEFNKLIFTLKRKEQQSIDPYPWFVEDYDRIN